MQELLDQFKALTDDEKIAFMKAAIPQMAEIFQKDPHTMMAEMMPSMMKQMMGES